jgi:hypothetical protein
MAGGETEDASKKNQETDDATKKNTSDKKDGADPAKLKAAADQQMAAMFDSMSLEQKLIMLNLYNTQKPSETAGTGAKPKTGSAYYAPSSGLAQPPGLGGAVSYVRVEPPFLPTFSGEGKAHTSYNLWKFELKCLMDNPDVSQASIKQAVRKSVKGLAADVLMCLGETASLHALIQKFDSHFGNTKTQEQLLQQFFRAEQGEDQSCTAWGCELEELMYIIRDKNVFSLETTNDMLRSKFWTGLRSERVKEALRHHVHNGETFESLLRQARIVDSEVSSSEASRPQKTKPQQHQQQVGADGKLDEILRQLRSLDGRVQKIEKLHASDKPTTSRNESQAKQPPKKKSKFYGIKGICWHCGDKEHRMWECPLN